MFLFSWKAKLYWKISAFWKSPATGSIGWQGQCCTISGSQQNNPGLPGVSLRWKDIISIDKQGWQHPFDSEAFEKKKPEF